MVTFEIKGKTFEGTLEVSVDKKGILEGKLTPKFGESSNPFLGKTSNIDVFNEWLMQGIDNENVGYSKVKRLVDKVMDYIIDMLNDKSSMIYGEKPEIIKVNEGQRIPMFDDFINESVQQ